MEEQKKIFHISQILCPLTDGAKNFRAFITNELFDEISKRYRLKNKRGIIEESLAGLFVMETFMQNPESFNFYIAFDPSLWWNNHYLVNNSNALLDEFPSKEIKLWFAGSSAEDISEYTNELAKVLKNDAPNKLKWKYSDEPNEKHNTIFRASKEKALKWKAEIIQVEQDFNDLTQKVGLPDAFFEYAALLFPRFFYKNLSHLREFKENS